jgi:SAM-dependent methyltransferase
MARTALLPDWPPARARALRASLRRGEIAPRLHYETAAQARKWLAVHRRWSPAAAARGRRFYAAALARVARGCRGETRVVSLGCGGGAKDLLLLRALRARGCRAEYVPCDVAAPLVARAAAACRRAAPLGCRPVVADLGRARQLACRLAALPRPRMPRLLLFLGMLPNLAPGAARRVLRAILRPGDTLVASANLLPPGPRAPRRVMAQYDNAETRAWLLELPRALGWPAGEGALRFRWGRDPEWRALRRVEARYRAKGAPGLLLFSSRRHAPSQLRAFARALGIRSPSLVLARARDEGLAWGTARPENGRAR